MDRFIVQCLTDMKWMGLSSTEEDKWVYDNARVLIALRKCLLKLQSFYTTLQDVPPWIPNESHPRYFPYPTTFIAEDNSLTCFQYTAFLEEDSACVTYLAEILNETDVTIKVVVKFVARYGKEVHEFLRAMGMLPPSDTTAHYQRPNSLVFYLDLLKGPHLAFACGRIWCIWL